MGFFSNLFSKQKENWFDKNGNNKITWTKYDENWFDKDWYNKNWYDKNWFDRDWWNIQWKNKDTWTYFDKNWYNKAWKHISYLASIWRSHTRSNSYKRSEYNGGYQNEYDWDDDYNHYYKNGRKYSCEFDDMRNWDIYNWDNDEFRHGWLD